MSRKTIFIVSLLLSLMVPFLAWAAEESTTETTAPVEVEVEVPAEVEANLFPSTLDLFIAQGSSGCSTITDSCRQDCCYAFEDCMSQCAPFDLQCRLACINQNYACEDWCLFFG